MMRFVKLSLISSLEDNPALLFRSLVRSHLEYANQVWCPYLRKDIEAVENVQRHATKLVPGLHDLTYSERLIALDMPTLVYRRLRGDMIEVFKILSDKCGYDSEVTEGFLKLSNNTTTRGHSLKLDHRRARLDIRKNCFSYRVVKMWNSLPEDVVCSPNIDTFKRRLDRHWRSQPIKFDHTAEFVISRSRPAAETNSDSEEGVTICDEEAVRLN